MQGRPTQMWTPMSSSRPPGVQAGSVSSGPTGSMFGQNGFGPVQAAMITDVMVPEPRRGQSDFVRPAVDLTEREYTLHGAVPICPEKLATLSEQAMHDSMTVHLGEMVENLVHRKVIAPNTPIVSVRVSVTNDSPIPLGCVMELSRIDYDPVTSNFGNRNFMDVGHSTKDLDALSAVIPPKKTVSFEPLPYRECTDAYPCRAYVYGLRSALRASQSDGYCTISRTSPVARYITDTIIMTALKNHGMEEVPLAENTKFWGSVNEKYGSIVTPLHNGTMIQVPESTFRQFASEIIRLRAQMLLAADCFRNHPWNNVKQKDPVMTLGGLSISFRPTDLVSTPPMVTEDPAKASVFSKNNIWIISASLGGSNPAIDAVRRNTYMVSFAVVVKFAVQPPDVLAKDLMDPPAWN